MRSENTQEAYLWKTAAPRPWFAGFLDDVPLPYSRALRGSPQTFETKSILSSGGALQTLAHRGIKGTPFLKNRFLGRISLNSESVGAGWDPRVRVSSRPPC